MFNFHGGTAGVGGAITPLGVYAGYLLVTTGNFWLGIAFLVLTSMFFVLILATLCRYVINYRRNQKHMQEYWRAVSVK